MKQFLLVVAALAFIFGCLFFRQAYIVEEERKPWQWAYMSGATSADVTFPDESGTTPIFSWRMNNIVSSPSKFFAWTRFDDEAVGKIRVAKLTFFEEDKSIGDANITFEKLSANKVRITKEGAKPMIVEKDEKGWTLVTK